MILKGADVLYPQYDLHEKLSEALEKWSPWVKEEAQKKLAQSHGITAHPDVMEHWKRLAS